jgi:hypothetical protein
MGAMRNPFLAAKSVRGFQWTLYPFEVETLLVRMRLLLTICFLLQLHFPANAQMEDESTLAFYPELDSVIIHAWNNGTKELDVTMYPYHHENWTRNNKEQACWLFVNDSFVILRLGNRPYYGIRKGDYIAEYDIKTRQEVKYPSLTRDSLQYSIYENKWYWNKNQSWHYEKDICDTIADSCLSFAVYSEGYISRNRTIKLSDSSTYHEFARIRNDSVFPESEYWEYYSCSSNRQESTSMIIRKNSGKYFSCQIDTAYSIKTYAYDSHNRLSYLHRVDYNTCESAGEVETDEMFLVYREEYSRKNAHKFRRFLK